MITKFKIFENVNDLNYNLTLQKIIFTLGYNNLRDIIIDEFEIFFKNIDDDINYNELENFKEELESNLYTNLLNITRKYKETYTEKYIYYYIGYKLTKINNKLPIKLSTKEYVCYTKQDVSVDEFTSILDDDLELENLNNLTEYIKEQIKKDNNFCINNIFFMKLIENNEELSKQYSHLLNAKKFDLL